MTRSLILQDQSVVELPGKYLRYGTHCYYCVTTEHELIMIDTSPLSLGVSVKIHTDIYVELLKKSVPISGAEFEHVLDATLKLINQKIYG